jgi:AraC-like DNA-binding protein
MEVRLRRAAQLLTGTELPIKSIAARVGFDRRSYFSRAFKAYTGKGPARFRLDAAE